MKYDKNFEQIAEDALAQAEALPCSMKQFYDGLRGIVATFENRIAVEQEEADYL